MKHIDKSKSIFSLSNFLNRYIDFTILLLLLFLPLFFYNLGSFSLIDFDEAWYAEIARNIIKTGNPLLLTYNSWPYMDHPPFGFIVESISMLIFGVNELAARFPQAFFGFLSVILTYYIGKKLFSKTVGMGAALILVSCVWFIFRARSGNLDTLFLFLYLATFASSLKIKENINWIYATAVFLALVLLTKTLIGLSILIPIIIFLFIEKVKLPKKKLFAAFIIFLALLLPWYIVNLIAYKWRFLDKINTIAFRPNNRIVPEINIFTSRAITYLHYGIWRWYKPAIISFVGTLFFVKSNKRIIPIYALIVILLFGFITNAVTEIWHLIPLYPFLGLLIAFFVEKIIQKSLLIIVQLLRKLHLSKLKKTPSFLPAALTTLPLLLLSTWQIYQFRYDIKLYDKGKTNLAFVASYAANRPERLYSDDDSILPSIIYYSEKNISLVRWQDPPKDRLGGFIQNAKRPYLMLTEKWKLEVNNIKPEQYQVIAQKGDQILILLN